MFGRIMTVTALVAGATALAPASAAAHDKIDLPGTVQRLTNGLIEVPLRTGPPLLTHGGDARQGPSIGGGTEARRPPVCASNYRQKVLYARQASAPDRSAASRPIIEGAIFNMNAELDRAGLESGGRHADFRVACTDGGDLFIGNVVNARTASFGDIVDAARLAGAIEPGTNYTIFYDDATPRECGIGSYQRDERPGRENDNNLGGAYAVIYRDCWDGQTAMHEAGHNMGAVQPGGPNATVTYGHCRDESDVMCYPDGAEGAAGMLARCAGGERFDCGYDDYFDTEPEAGEYLASHWNLGSSANRFIEFSDPVPGETAGQTTCEEDGEPAPALAVDQINCSSTADEEAEDETTDEMSVRIRRVVHHERSSRVQAFLECPADRASACRGRLLLARDRSRGTGGRSFRVTPGSGVSLRLPLVPSARRALSAGKLRRVWVIARASDETADATRALRLKRGAK